MRQNWTLSRALLVLLAGAGAFGIQVPAHAQDAPHHTRVRYAFSSVGIVRGQALRISVASGRLIPPPVPDKVRIRLLDATGNVVADSEERVLPAVQTVSFDVDRDDLPEGGDPGTGRFQLRAVVVVANPNGLPPGPIRPGVEALETSTGRTTFLPPSPIAELLP